MTPIEELTAHIAQQCDFENVVPITGGSFFATWNGRRFLIFGVEIGEDSDFPSLYPDGVPGVRDPDHPCDMYSPGEPSRGDCAGDGHHLCRGCTQYEIEDDQ